MADPGGQNREGTYPLCSCCCGSLRAAKAASAGGEAPDPMPVDARGDMLASTDEVGRASDPPLPPKGGSATDGSVPPCSLLVNGWLEKLAPHRGGAGTSGFGGTVLADGGTGQRDRPVQYLRWAFWHRER